MNDGEQGICRNIHHFILFELTDKLDEVAFAQASMLGFGRYLFDVVNRNVAGSTDDLIKTVVRAITRKDTAHEDDPYWKLCHSVLRFAEIPRKIYFEYLRQYTTVFGHEYVEVVAEANSRIGALNASLDANKDSIESIIATSNSSLHITKDIRESEKRLSALYQQCNEMRTQKEMLQYILEYIDECMSKFCDFKDRAVALSALREKALETAKEGHLTVDDDFEYYKEILRIGRANISNIFGIIHAIKLQPFYDDIRQRAHGVYHHDGAEQEKTLKAFQEECDALPKIATLEEAKSKDVSAYRALLEDWIRKYDLPSNVTEKINGSVSISGRKSILLQAISLFGNGEYDVFNNIVPIQLEGLFADLLKDGTVFPRFRDLNIYPRAVLREKISYIKNLGVDVYPEAVMYFGYYFNNLVRNKVAHGIYIYGNDDLVAVFAMEMLLDLNALVHMLLRKSETEKMYRLIRKYKDYMSTYFKEPNHHFGFLFNDLTRSRTHLDYDSVEKLSPMQFAYWLVNTYYEEIYARVGNVAELKELRADFISNDFWLFVLDKLNDVIKVGYDYLGLDQEFFSVVRGLFRCDLPSDTKATLAKVNAALSQIRKLH